MAVSYKTKGADASLRVKESGTLYITNNGGQSNDENEELSYDEQREREQLERLVERAFYEAGRALKQLRDKRLYRDSHTTFEEYCRERFNYNRSRSYQLIDAATVVDNLQECPPLVDILPTTERQVRSLVSLEPSEQRACWQKAVEEAGGKAPSGNVVKSIVDKIRERTKIPVPYSKGEVCTIITKDNPDLKGKGGHWCIVGDVYEFSCQVLTWDGEFIMKPENLKSLDMLEDDSAAMQELSSRLRHLNSIEKIDDIERSILQAMGKRTKPLTPVQEEVLTLIEKAYGVG
jgi:hypothetical protein